jgi:hypothetical protein
MENNQNEFEIPAPGEATNEEAAAPTLIETDYRAYQRWRETGEEPAAQAEETPAAGDQTPAETAVEATDPADDPETEDTPEDGPKKKGGYQRKIDKLAQENAALAARLAALETPKPAASAQPSDAPVGEEVPAADTSDKPKPEDFDTYEEYVDKLTDWKLDRRSKQAQQQQAETQGRERAAEIGKAWQDRQAEARKDPTMPNFDRVTQVDIPVSDAMAAVILESPDGARLAYWLGSNATEAARISKLHPLAAAAELGGILKGLKPASKPATAPAASRAPKPITPVTRGGSTATHAGGVYDEKTANDFTAWRNARNAQLGKK